MLIENSGNSKTRKAFLFAMMFLLVLFSNDTTAFGTNIKSVFVTLGFIIEVLLVVTIFCAYLVSSSFRIKIDRNITIIFFVMIDCVLLSAVLNNDFRNGFITSILLIIIGFVFSEVVSFNSFCKAFLRVFELLAFCSVMGKIITDIFPSVLNHGIRVVNSNGLKFYSFILYARSTEPIASSRNFSIFREPGVYQSYLLISLVFAIIFFDGKKKGIELFGICSIIIAVVLTVSTTGYICLFLVLFFFLVRKNYLKRSNKLALFLFGLSLLGILLLLYFQFFVSDSVLDFLQRTFLSKFDRKSEYYSSGITRIAAIRTNVSLWLEKPLFGLGITKKQELYPYAAMSLFNYRLTIDTNTVLAQFSLFGIIVGFFWVIAIWGFSRGLSKNIYEKLIISLLLVILLMTEFFVFSALCNILIWYGIRAFFNKEITIKSELSVPLCCQ